MKHYGDICKMNGAEVERVCVVIGGSPCQDLSVAGKRAGLAGERSGLFMEQIRVIKEMRERDRSDGRTGTDVFPRFMVWENVQGAFSINGGEDFRAVLEETVRVAEPTAVIPRYEGGRWTNAGAIIGDGWSVAWRTHDAQYWGVPQRRRRISLVADFGGESAPEILFESESMRGDSAESGEAREGTAGSSEDGVASTITATYGTKWNGNAGAYSGGNFVIGKRSASVNGKAELIGLTNRGYSSGDIAETVRSDPYGAYPMIAGTLKARYDGSPNPDIGSGQEIVVQENTVLAFKLGNGEKARSIGLEENISPTLNAECGGNKPAICIQGNCIDRADTAGCNGRGWRDDDISYTLNTIDRPAVMAFSQNGSGDTTVHPKCNAITANQNPSGRGTAMVYGFQPQAGGNTGCAVTEDGSPCLGTTQRPAVFDARGNGDGEICPTITGDHENRVTDYTAVCIGNGQANNTHFHEMSPALSCMHDQQAVMVRTVCCGSDSPDGSGTLDASYYKGVGARNRNERTVVAVDCRNGTENEVNGTLQAKSNGGTSVNLQNICRTESVVRRLTPLECERLQGFPDGWTDIGEWTDEKGKRRQTTDSARYRALGNSIALPFWYWLLKRIMEHCEEKTMGSLFDGIGGFPLCWNAAGGETLWASEIEPFCIGVTKKHFGDEETGEKGDWIEFFKR